MDAARHWIALVSTAFLLPLLLYWPLIHGFIGFWRRVGVTGTCVVVMGGLAAAAVALGFRGERLLIADLGLNWPLHGAGFVLLGFAAWLRHLIGRGMPTGRLVGLPELKGESEPAGLVQEGIYARVRHPRYLQLLVSQLGWALLANHVTPYLLWIVWVGGVWGIVLMEERELRARFGAEYEAYCRRVPRFIPLPAASR